MTDEDQQRTVQALLDRYQRQSLAEQAEIHLRDSPNTLFQAFQLGLLLDARVSPEQAMRVLTTFREQGWTTTKGFVDAQRNEVMRALDQAGYPEQDADRLVVALADAALHLEDDHGGDLGGLRRASGEDPQRIRESLERFAKIREKGIDGFFREVQVVWDELAPFADKETLDAADRLGLGEDAACLRGLVDSDEDFVRLADALLRAHREEKGLDQVRQAAAPSD